jgi:hypothetical protein
VGPFEDRLKGEPHAREFVVARDRFNREAIMEMADGVQM